jgi:hypothetical protein
VVRRVGRAEVVVRGGRVVGRVWRWVFRVTGRARWVVVGTVVVGSDVVVANVTSGAPMARPSSSEPPKAASKATVPIKTSEASPSSTMRGPRQRPLPSSAGCRSSPPDPNWVGAANIDPRDDVADEPVLAAAAFAAARRGEDAAVGAVGADRLVAEAEVDPTPTDGAFAERALEADDFVDGELNCDAGADGEPDGGGDCGSANASVVAPTFCREVGAGSAPFIRVAVAAATAATPATPATVATPAMASAEDGDPAAAVPCTAGVS